MKNLKFLLPMLAIIFVIGVAFTAPGNVEEAEVQAFDYYFADGVWEAIPEQDCGVGENTCRVQIGTNGPIYPLYDEMDDLEPKESSSPLPIVL